MRILSTWSATTAKGKRPQRRLAVNANLELVYLLGPIFFVVSRATCYIGYRLDSKSPRRGSAAALGERDGAVAATLAQAQAAEFPDRPPGKAWLATRSLKINSPVLEQT